MPPWQVRSAFRKGQRLYSWPLNLPTAWSLPPLQCQRYRHPGRPLLCRPLLCRRLRSSAGLGQSACLSWSALGVLDYGGWPFSQG